MVWGKITMGGTNCELKKKTERMPWITGSGFQRKNPGFGKKRDIHVRDLKT